MTQPTGSYSARDAIAHALYAYQRALEAYQQREQRARAGQQLTEQNARRQYQEAKQQLQDRMNTEKTSVQQMMTEANSTLAAADQWLAQSGLTKRIAAPKLQPIGAARARPSKQEIQSAFARIKASEANLRREVQAWSQYQQTFLARLLSAIGLGP